ncbi:MAG: hypothetical protein WD749_03075 [Phycisphaerales bacterium]
MLNARVQLVVLAIAMFIHPQAGYPQPARRPVAPEAAPPTAEALLAALAVHDARLRSLEWRQRVTVSLAWLSEPVAIQEGFLGFDDDGNWYRQDRYAVVPEVGQAPRYFERFIAAGDGEVRGLQRPDATKGLVRAPDGHDRALYPTPETLLGRWLETACDCPMSEFLKAARKHSVEPLQSGRVRLRAWRAVGAYSTFVDVDCDPQREYLPMRIEICDALLGSPIVTLETTECQQRDGAWVPTRGTKTAWDRAWTDDQVEQLTAALEAEGFRKPWNPEDHATEQAHRRAIEQVFGRAGVPVRPLGMGTLTMEVTEVTSINTPLDRVRFQLPYPQGWRVFNSLLDVMEDPDGSHRVPVERY